MKYKLGYFLQTLQTCIFLKFLSQTLLENILHITILNLFLKIHLHIHHHLLLKFLHTFDFLIISFLNLILLQAKLNLGSTEYYFKLDQMVVKGSKAQTKRYPYC